MGTKAKSACLKILALNDTALGILLLDVLLRRAADRRGSPTFIPQKNLGPKFSKATALN
jgi:hypothetical protein